jgi:hypothetical protein
MGRKTRNWVRNLQKAKVTTGRNTRCHDSHDYPGSIIITAIAVIAVLPLLLLSGKKQFIEMTTIFN